MGEETREDEAEGEEDLDDDPDDDEDEDEGEEWSWPGGIDRRLSIMVWLPYEEVAEESTK